MIGPALAPAPFSNLILRPFFSISKTARSFSFIKSMMALMKENDLAVFEMEKNGLKIKLEKGAGTSAGPIIVAPTAPQAAAAPAAPVAERPREPLKEIVSPMEGTFYRDGPPDAGPFVDVGAQVTEDTVVCIIEAMKVMNEIKAETSGVIAEVGVENGKPVQFGQVLFRVR